MPTETNKPPLTIKLKSVSKNLHTTKVAMISNPRFNIPKLFRLAPSVLVTIPITKTSRLISRMERGEYSPTMKSRTKTINAPPIGWMRFRHSFFRWSTNSPEPIKVSRIAARNSGELMTSVQMKSSFRKCSQNQSKLRVSSKTIVPTKPKTL